MIGAQFYIQATALNLVSGKEANSFTGCFKNAWSRNLEKSVMADGVTHFTSLVLRLQVQQDCKIKDNH